MSSIVIWSDKTGRVTAQWNKHGLPTVHVVHRVDARTGIAHATVTKHRNSKAAIAAARRKAKALP